MQNNQDKLNINLQSSKDADLSPITLSEDDDSSNKIAVVMMNLGGPSDLAAVKPFLFNLFYDKAIMRLPNPFRWILAQIISTTRSNKSKNIYAKMGNKSPILTETLDQAKALEVMLNNKKHYDICINREADQRVKDGQKDAIYNEIEELQIEVNGADDVNNIIHYNVQGNSPIQSQYRTFVLMRYWHPRSPEVIKELLEFQPDKIILLPMYPQFSTTTTASAVEDYYAAVGKQVFDKQCYYDLSKIDTRVIEEYHNASFFTQSYADIIRKVVEQKAIDANISDIWINHKILFSAHSLPQKIIDQGDPYQEQICKSANLIAQHLGLQKEQFEICYQSKVGPLKWLEPSTEKSIIKAAKNSYGVVVVPIAFVSEHSETLVELDIDYKDLYLQHGGPSYIRIPTLRCNEQFIAGLARLCWES
jgi:ferrochelatase